MHDPIVITGLGLLSPLGIGIEETAMALREGAPAPGFSARMQTAAGEVPPFQLAECGVAPKAYLDRHSELLLAACGLAFRHAAIDPATLTPECSGILAGAAWGGQDTMAAFFDDYVRKGPRLVKPFLFPHAYFNTSVSLAAMEWSLRGPHQAFATGRIAAGQALVEAYDLLRENAADLLLVGGCEALGATLVRALTIIGDLAGAGHLPGEASAMFVLERTSRAHARGVQPQATILGTGLAGSNGVPGADGVTRAARQALDEAGLKASALSAIVSSATGAAGCDAAEAQAVAALTTPAHTPVVSPVAFCGDSQGATAALHTALAVVMRAHHILPRLDAAATPLPPGPILVLAADPCGSATALVIA